MHDFTVLASGMAACRLNKKAAIEFAADYVQINYKDTTRLKLVNKLCNLLSTYQSLSRRQATGLLFQNF